MRSTTRSRKRLRTMCFRPAEVSMNKCPACGKLNKPIAKTCEQCGEPLELKKTDFDADQAKLDAANIAAPSAPRIPAAPGDPQAPGRPQPPSPPQM